MIFFISNNIFLGPILGFNVYLLLFEFFELRIYIWIYA